MRNLISHWAVVLAAWFILSPVATAAQSESELAHILERTVHIGNCSGVILPPQQDASGKWHWFVASAAHCASGRDRSVSLLYPADNTRKFKGKEVVRFGGSSPSEADMMIIEIEFPPGAEPLPFAELAGVKEAKESDAVVVTGYPASGVRVNPKHSGLVWKPAKIKSVGEIVTLDQGIDKGNSGGPVWHGNKVLGIASRSNDVSSLFSGPDSVHKGYHEACAKVGIMAKCSDEDCFNWDILKPKPGREPYRAPPNEQVVKFTAEIAKLNAKIQELEAKLDAIQVKNGSDGKDATVRIGTVTFVDPDSKGRVVNSGTPSDAVLDFEIPRGRDGEDGNDGDPGQAGPAGPVGDFAVQFELMKEKIEAIEKIAKIPDRNRKLVIYLTAEDHPDVALTDAKVAALAASGYNIRTVRLKRKDADVEGVPRAHVFPEGTTIRGKDNVMSYLTQLVN